MSDESIEHEETVRYGDAWFMDGFESAWWEATHEYAKERWHRQDKFRNPLRVSVTIETEEFDADRVRECDAIGGTVSRHRCPDCESCLIRKRTVEGDVLFYECPEPGCGWVTTEVLR